MSNSNAIQSRTMKYATNALTTPTNRDAGGGVIQDMWRSFTASVPAAFRPKGTRDTYWTIRAFTAEKLLSVQLSHHQEMLQVIAEGNERRDHELRAVHKMHESYHARMERLILSLMAILTVLLVALIYTANLTPQTTTRSGWANPLHFTIPVLSPFASVIEHETSALSTRTLTIIACISAVLVYGCFRYWLTYRR